MTLPLHDSSADVHGAMTDTTPTGAASAAALFAGPGEVRTLARAFDWNATPLGWPDAWPSALRIATRAMLDVAYPVCLWSGPGYTLVYNDAYRRILAGRHPAALGQPGAVVWADIWPTLESQFAQVWHGGAPVYDEVARFFVARHEGGDADDAWYSYSLSALRDEAGHIVALLNISPELERANQQLERQAADMHAQAEALRATASEREELLTEGLRANAELQRVTAVAQAGERRAQFLGDLGQALQPVSEPDALMETAARLLGEHLGVDRCAYAEVEADEDHFTITGNYTRGDTSSIIGRFAFRAFGEECLRLMRADRAYVVDDAATDVRVTAADRVAYESTQIRAVICVPLHKAGRFVAAMAVHQRVPRRWSDSEVSLVVTVVQRCWESLERASALRRLRERETALEAALIQLEERTAAAESARLAAEAANEAKAAFLSTMSHELRTPLNAIEGYAELLALGIRGPVTDAQRQDLERLRMANQHMSGLVTDLLGFARIEAGQIEYHTELVPVAPLVNDLDALIRPQFAARGIAYDHDGCVRDTGDAPHTVCADPEKVRQILLNLLSNAAKYTDAGGQVSLACETDVAAGVVHFRVRDTGHGIAPEYHQRVFEPFVQIARHRTRTSQQGVGLGLAISRDLARGMHGELAVDSTLGVGSTFTLTLPSG